MNEDNRLVVAKSKTPDGAVLTEKNITKEYCAMEHRIEQLEQLCRDMYERVQMRDKEVSRNFGWSKQACLFSDRMEALGLLEGGE